MVITAETFVVLAVAGSYICVPSILTDECAFNPHIIDQLQ